MTPLELLKKQYEHTTHEIDVLKTQQKDILRELRSVCTHLRLGEYRQPRPWRICLDCGAEEESWSFESLQMRRESQRKDGPERGLVEIFHGSHELCQQRKAGERYLVGASAR